MDEPKEILVEIGGKLVKLTLRYDTYLAVYWGKHMGELIRCEDCTKHKHWECPIEQAGYRPKEDGYCFDAERRTDNG